MKYVSYRLIKYIKNQDILNNTLLGELYYLNIITN